MIRNIEKLLSGLSLLLSFFMLSCLSTAFYGNRPIQPPSAPPSLNVGQLREDLTANTGDILRSTIKLRTASSRLVDLLPTYVPDDTTRKLLGDEVNIISYESTALERTVEKFLEMGYRLDRTERYIDELEEWGKREQIERAAIEKRTQQLQQKVDVLATKSKKSFMYVWFGIVGVCALFILVGAYLIFYSFYSPGVGRMRAIGTSLIATGISVICVTYFFIDYAWLVGIFGAVIVVLIFIWIYREFVKEHKKCMTNENAITEIVTSIQEEKNSNVHFKNLWKKSVRDHMQYKYSDNTKRIVHETKNNKYHAKNT